MSDCCIGLLIICLAIKTGMASNLHLNLNLGLSGQFLNFDILPLTIQIGLITILALTLF